DWRAVAEGRGMVKVRQLPGPFNSMGRIKIPFPNALDIYLHDTPNKDLFAHEDRTLSPGCIRLEDAEGLGRWLLGREPRAASRELLAKPVEVQLAFACLGEDSAGLLLILHMVVDFFLEHLHLYIEELVALPGAGLDFGDE